MATRLVQLPAPTQQDPRKLNAVLHAHGIYTAEEMAELDQIRNATYFLLRNSGPNDDPAPCKECKSIHPYFTLRCIERPWKGLDSVLQGYVSVRSDDDKARVLATRFSHLDALHPQTARLLKPHDRGEDLVAFSLGLVEPITKETAERLVWRINLSGLKPLLRL